jgi:hypothetical protein
MLMDDELKLVEAHLSSCPLCKDAVEGSRLFNKEAVAMDEMTEKVNMRLRQRFDYHPANKKAVARGPGLRSFIIPAAASIIILISIISYFHLLFPESNELAQLDEEEVLVPEQEKAATIGGVYNREAEEKGVPATSQDKKEAEPPQKDVVVSTKEEKIAEAEEISVVEEDIVLTELNVDVTVVEEKQITDESITANAMKEFAGTGIQQEDAAVISRAKAGKKAADATNEMIMVYDQDPSFPGGKDSLYVFLARYMKYNVVSAQAADTTVLVQFIVSRKGSCKDFNFIQGAGEDVNKEVLRVLKMMPDWIPAVKEGKNIEGVVSLPVFLKLK